MKVGGETAYRNKQLLLPAIRVLTSCLLLSSNPKSSKIRHLFGLYANSEGILNREGLEELIDNLYFLTTSAIPNAILLDMKYHESDIAGLSQYRAELEYAA